MAERPIILFPEPQLADRDKRRKNPMPIMNKPTFRKQYNRLQPAFNVLKDAFEKKRIQIQNAPVGMNPEYALVFEVVDSVDSFYTAVKNSEGLEWLFDKESFDIEPDEDFYYDKDKTKNLSGKVYCVMSNQEAMEQMLSCWRRFNDGESDVFARGYAGLRDIFVNIKQIRTWTAEDRIQETQILKYWRDSLEIDGNIAVPFEVELFYRNDQEKRTLAEKTIILEVERLGGRILSKCHISEIAYHSLLVELPRNRIEELVENYDQVQLVHIDDVMFLRPICQSAFNVYADTSVIEDSILQMAMQGKLVEQRAEEGTADELYEQIVAEKAQLIKDGKIKKEKPLPEIAEDEIPFDIPSSWKWVRLGTIVSVYGGKRIPAGTRLSENDTGHKYIRVADMKDETVSLDDIKYITDEIYEKIKQYFITSDDIYITVAGTIGRVGVVPRELNNANLTENADKLVFRRLDKMYLCRMLNSEVVQHQIREATTQVGQPKLAIARIQKLIVPLPPLEEQKRIVAKIEELLPYCDQLIK